MYGLPLAALLVAVRGAGNATRWAPHRGCAGAHAGLPPPPCTHRGLHPAAVPLTVQHAIALLILPGRLLLLLLLLLRRRLLLLLLLLLLTASSGARSACAAARRPGSPQRRFRRCLPGVGRRGGRPAAARQLAQRLA